MPVPFIGIRGKFELCTLWPKWLSILFSKRFLILIHALKKFTARKKVSFLLIPNHLISFHVRQNAFDFGYDISSCNGYLRAFENEQTTDPLFPPLFTLDYVRCPIFTASRSGNFSDFRNKNKTTIFVKM